MTEQRAKWPKHLIVPSEVQFQHGAFVDFDPDKTDGDLDELDEMRRIERAGDDGDLRDDEDREKLKYHCGTSCCFVGWACLAFGEEGVAPDAIRNPATVQFLNKFIELAGRDIVYRESNGFLENFEYFSRRVGWEASNAFEGINENGGFNQKLELSPRQARNLWKKTGEHFNYDVDNLLE